MSELENLKAQVAALTARLGPVPEPPPQVGAPWPRAVYRRGGRVGQLDHPGWESKVVASPAALETAVADGWTEDCGPFVYAADVPALPAPVPTPNRRGPRA